MKGYKWSNGETVDAQDVVFWMNLLKANATSWAAYAPGPTQFPGNVVNVVGQQRRPTRSPSRSTRLTASSGSPNNELSQVSPLPIAWDISSSVARRVRAVARSAAYASVKTALQTIKGTPTLVQTSASAKDCAAVYAYLTGKTEGRRSWHLRHEPALADRGRALQVERLRRHDNGATVVPNKPYSGPVKPSIDKLVMAPFTTDTAEFNVLAVAGARSTSATCRRRTCPSTRASLWCGADRAMRRGRTTRNWRRTTTWLRSSAGR